jgi:hypothetical protein
LLSHTLLSPGEIRERPGRITLFHLAGDRIFSRGFEQWDALGAVPFNLAGSGNAGHKSRVKENQATCQNRH